MLLILSQAATATGLEKFLESQRPSKNHSAHLIAQAEGALQGEVPVKAVLFTFVHNHDRDPIHAQFLAVLPKEGFAELSSLLPSRVVRVGGATQHFSTLSVSGGLIRLDGKSYASGDPRCCPSVKVAVHYRLDGQWLTALANPD